LNLRHTFSSLFVLFVATASQAQPPPRFQQNGGETRDTQTGLRWQRVPASRTMKLAEARDYCAKLSLGGAGWRLPAREELLAIVKKGASPAIDGAAFPSTARENFWTSTKKKDSAFQSVVDFSTGEEGVSPELIEQRVRCVHDASPANTAPPQCPAGTGWNGTMCVAAQQPLCPANYFWNGSACAPVPSCPPDQKWNGSICTPVEQLVSNGKYAVTPGHARDTQTGLVWERSAPTAKMKKADAEAHCKMLAIDGGGYRLPTREELETIVVKGSNPAIDGAAFFGTGTDAYWTSSKGSAGDFFVVVSFFSGMEHPESPEIPSRVRCVKKP
jgi:hypothetical protein